jgi:hypothetical protein
LLYALPRNFVNSRLQTLGYFSISIYCLFSVIIKSSTLCIELLILEWKWYCCGGQSCFCLHFSFWCKTTRIFEAVNSQTNWGRGLGWNLTHRFGWYFFSFVLRVFCVLWECMYLYFFWMVLTVTHTKIKPLIHIPAFCILHDSAHLHKVPAKSPIRTESNFNEFYVSWTLNCSWIWVSFFSSDYTH